MDFYNFFSFSGKKAIYRASEVCAQFNNNLLEPEHIFYSILNLRSCSASQVLHQLNVNLPKLKYSLEAYLYEHSGSYKGSASFSTRTLALLDMSFKEVKRLQHREIGTTHLLIALSQEPSQFLRNLFEDHNLDQRKIRDLFKTHLKDYREDLEQATDSAGNVQGFRVTQQSSRPRRLSDINCSDACQRILLQSAFIAGTYGLRLIEPVHVLISLLMEEECAAGWVLQRIGAIPGQLLMEIAGDLQHSAESNFSSAKFSEVCWGLVRQAQQEQQDLRQREMLSMHLLLAMLVEPANTELPILAEQGITRGSVMAAFIEYLQNGSESTAE